MPAGRSVRLRCVVQEQCVRESDRGGSGRCADDAIVRLDGIGGAIILMRASLHREGVYFPPFPFNHSIETVSAHCFPAQLTNLDTAAQEGLAKMASEMGTQPFGMPMVKVWHK